MHVLLPDQFAVYLKLTKGKDFHVVVLVGKFLCLPYQCGQCERHAEDDSRLNDYCSRECGDFILYFISPPANFLLFCCNQLCNL